MNERHRAIRALLSSMSPPRAIAYIKAFELPTDEESVIIACDVRRRSCVQVAQALNMTEDTVKRNRKRGYAKIADGIS